MHPTWDILHGFIYAAMGLYAAAGVLFALKVRRAAWIVYGAGCAVAVAGWIYRWHDAGHVPLQNLFEVFLTLGALMFPITLFSRRFLDVGREGGDAFIGLLVLFPIGFVFSDETKPMMPALQSFLFVPHVAAYMVAYVVMGKALVQALGAYAVKTRLAMLVFVLPRLGLALYAYASGGFVPLPVPTLLAGWLLAPATAAGYDAGERFLDGSGAALAVGIGADLLFWALIALLVWRARPLARGDRLRAERDAHVVVRLGFPVLTLGLVLGAVWGKLAWGDYWNWDPKELWSLVSWLIFLGYLHVRYLYGKRYARANASLVLAGVVAIVLTLLWVNLAGVFSGGLHSYAT